MTREGQRTLLLLFSFLSFPIFTLSSLTQATFSIFQVKARVFCPSLCLLSLLFLSFRAVTAVLCRRPRFSGQFLQNVFLVKVCYFIGLHRFTYCTVSIGGLVALVFGLVSLVVILGSFADAITVFA